MMHGRSEVTIHDELAAAEREMALRSRLYPRWVASGKLKPQQAEWEKRCMEAIVQRLARIAGDRCPRPWPGDDGTGAQCLQNNHCSCQRREQFVARAPDGFACPECGVIVPAGARETFEAYEKMKRERERLIEALAAICGSMDRKELDGMIVTLAAVCEAVADADDEESEGARAALKGAETLRDILFGSAT